MLLFYSSALPSCPSATTAAFPVSLTSKSTIFPDAIITKRVPSIDTISAGTSISLSSPQLTIMPTEEGTNIIGITSIKKLLTSFTWAGFITLVISAISIRNNPYTLAGMEKGSTLESTSPKKDINIIMANCLMYFILFPRSILIFSLYSIANFFKVATKKFFPELGKNFSGDGGIRTPVPVSRLTDFESAPL